MSKHAILPPSDASRWLTCTPSARLEQEFPNTSSSYADEGTLAHAVGECILRQLSGFITSAEAETIMAVHMNNQYYNKELHDYADGYAYYVWNQCKPGKTELFIETRLGMTEWIEDGFGTADALVIGDRVLIFNDYKHGKGVPVYAPENKQLMIYALGAYTMFKEIFEIDAIQMNIYQPRIDNVSGWEISVADLLVWAETELKPKAVLAYAGEGEFSPGKACIFCRAKSTCRALHDYNMELAALEFKNPDLLTDEEVALVLQRSDIFSKWIDAVAGYALATAVSGEKQWPGYKICEGRSVRKYSSEVIVATKLESAGYKDIYTEPKLLGLGALEKKLSKPIFQEIVEPLLIKPSGSPVLVLETDKRPVYSVAASEFQIVTDEDI
jgi:transcription elongation factor Elf1